MVKKLTRVFVVMVLFAMFLFAGCTDEAGEQMPVVDNTDTTQNSQQQDTTQEQPQDVLDETLDTELVDSTDSQEVEIGSLI